MGRRRKYVPKDEKLSDAGQEGLLGPVKEVMITTYKAQQKGGIVSQGKIESDFYGDDKNNIITYDEKGTKRKLMGYGKEMSIISYFDDNPHLASKSETYYLGNLYSTTTHKLTEKMQLLETISLNADGLSGHKVFNNYADDGKQIDGITYHLRGGKDIVFERSIFTYDEKRNQLSHITYKDDDTIKQQITQIYNEEGKNLETKFEFFEKNMQSYGSRTTHKYNKHGDSIETVMYDSYGNVKHSYSQTHEYDVDGKRIVPIVQPYIEEDEPVSEIETEVVENDAHENWIKKTTYYNKVAKYIYLREINYYGEPEKVLIHPMTLIAKEEISKEKIEVEELTTEQAKYLMESMPGPENFPLLRYYSLFNNEAPSILNINDAYIEAFALREELLEEMDAVEIFSSGSKQAGYSEHINRYILSFENHKGYMLISMGIHGDDEDEFDVPENVDIDDGQVYFSSFQLLRPSDASGKRDEEFEEELDNHISNCIIHKKPDKPVIQMIETNQNGFAMKEHAVDDNFEIKDLDLNYGYGFEKFHDELMHRFNISTKGLVLFHGLPGTGKTFYIRHLLRKMAINNKIVIYMPPNMVDHLVDPGFMTFLAEQVQEWSEEGNFCVLLIEDAEPLLAKRQEGVRIQGVTNLLNMTDGLLNDMLNLQIICTFNVDLKKLDSALLRPGRLLARKEFVALSELDANLLAQRLGIKHHFKKPATLGEIYALRKNQSTLIHEVESDRDASTVIDDL